MLEPPKQIRLDSYISTLYTQYSRALIQKLIKNGHVKLDNVMIDKPSFKVLGNEKVFVDENPLKVEDKTLDLEVVYEDQNLVVINKPIGILVHSKGEYNPEATVATWLANRPGFDFKDVNERSGIVHRLDRATSGLMICSKNKQTLGFFQKQFQNRKTKKTYVAIVRGVPKQSHAMIDLPIDRNPQKPQTFRVKAGGKSAQTEYEVIKHNDKFSLIELKPISGRTHQLRVHLAYLGCPIVGDVLYGGDKADRLYLHAKSLEITLPGGIRKVFDSQLPKEFINNDRYFN